MRSASCPFDQSLWWSIQEDKFGVKLLFQLQLTSLSHLKQRTANHIAAWQPIRLWMVFVGVVRKVHTRKMSVQSLRMRSTQGSSSNMMEWLMPLKNSRTNFPITKTTEAYNPMMLQGEGREEEEEESGWILQQSVLIVNCTTVTAVVESN